jgi:hypothetical protein
VTQQRSPAQIQQEIELTRAQLANTIDELAERASPKRVAAMGRQQLTETPRGRTVLAASAGLVVAWVALKLIARRRHR